MAKRKSPYTPQIYHYLKRYQDDPNSRVFAPLAEAYRKAGLVDEAIEICREGLQVHRNFVGGRVALARALFDKKLYDDVIQELKDIVEDVPDNLVAQRLFAESCLMKGRVAEALTAYKMLLYFSPRDEETARMVAELESEAYQKGALVLERSSAPQPSLERPAKPPEREPELSRFDPGVPDQEMGGFNVRPVKSALSSDPDEQRALWRRRVFALQALLLKVERYRWQAEDSA